MKWAHSIPGKQPDQWQRLEAHLQNVAEYAREFAALFQSGPWAYLAGLLHDLGKASPAFQAYLLRSNGLDPSNYDTSGPSTHSGAGAAWAIQKFGPIGRAIAYLVSGHHAGLPDWIAGVQPLGALSQRMQTANNELRAVQDWIDQMQLPEQLPPITRKMQPKEIHLWIRMLFSCLVDADRLDTEQFMDPANFAERRSFPALTSLADQFFSRLDAIQSAAEKTEVNAIRAEIRQACEAAAEQPPGIFTLTVPTGGGKTLSGTAFALRHALRHDKRRIIYVIPYTSIIEQTANTLRRHFGASNVVEHHSNLDPETQEKAARLASENWDAPIIVTTSVQFFDSLFAARSSRCRKLHNIVNSVVILDEVQLLPPELLEPCTDVLSQLAAHYGVTLVLSTATQPVLPNLGLTTEIIPPGTNLSQRLQRVRYILPDIRANQPLSWAEIADELQQYDQVLCVVNTRRDCRELYDLMPQGTIHLSASMCGAHRSSLIQEIRNKLSSRESIRVISTQLIEAGVDIDFPVVYRALAGLDSIAQSAGRCNREGRLPKGGKVVVFIPPKPSPKGHLRRAEGATRVLLHEPIDLNNAEIFPRYFQEFFARVEDRYPYQTLLVNDAHHLEIQFRQAAAEFHFIDDSQSSVFVRYGQAEELLRTLKNLARAGAPYGFLLRKLQRYSISIARGHFDQLKANGLIEEFAPGLFVWNGLYAETTGADIFNAKGILPTQETVI